MDGLPNLFRSHQSFASVRLRAIQETLLVPLHRISLINSRLALLVRWILEVKCPQQFRDAEEHVALGEVHARADATAGAVAVMVSALPVPGRVLRCKFLVRGIPLGDEGRGVFVGVRVHVHAPCVDDDYGAFGEEFPIDPVVCQPVNLISKSVLQYDSLR